MKLPLADVKDVTLSDTLSVDTCTPCHGDLNGDAVGDPVTGDLKRNQRVSPRATHLGSLDKSRLIASIIGYTPPK